MRKYLNTKVLFSRDGKTDYIFDNLIYGDMSLRHGYLGKRAEREQGFNLFKEIDTIPWFKNQWNLEELNLESSQKFDLRGFSEKLKNILVDVIRETWKNGMFHLIQHSSGYDSRILSGIIKELYKQNEIDGEIHFVCWEPEGPFFKKIMGYEGWGSEKYSVYRDGMDEQFYHSCSVDPFNIWKCTNGSLYNLDTFFHVLTDLQVRGVVPEKNVQVYRAGYFNESLTSWYHPGKNHLRGFMDFCYNAELTSCIAPTLCDETIFPILDYEAWKLIIGNEISKVSQEIKPIREEIVKLIDPDLFKLTRHSGDCSPRGGEGIDNHQPNPFRVISSELLNRSETFYKNSWYGKQNIYQPTNELWYYTDWWNHFVAAATCERAISKGVCLK